MFKFLVFTCISVVAAQNVEQDSKLVTIAQGPVLGHKNHDYDIYEFIGIPYATAPMGTLRFTAPQAAPTWTDTLDAVDRGIICHQVEGFPGIMQEDCLVANIYTPDTEETNLPVLVIVHGGGYKSAYGHIMAPLRLVGTKKMVAVTFNYRLGIHGFLCLGTKEAPGNAGLKDQLALLRWVKSNIANFGGNPDDVTISGYSAGATSVDLLMISKSAEGLFNKVIPESGSNVATWSAHANPIQSAKNYAKLLNFTNFDDIEALEEFYKSASYDVLFPVIDNVDEIQYNLDLFFTPCVENDVGEEMIIDDSPVKIIQEGRFTKVPLLYGFTDMEGLTIIPVYDDWFSVMNKKFSDFIPGDLEFASEDEKETVAHSLKEFYFGNNRIGIKTIFGFINYYTDVLFAYPTLRSAKMQIETGHDSIYLYEYTFFKRFPSVPGVPELLINTPGADHIDKTNAILDYPLNLLPEESYTEEYRRMRATMVELWTNFITTGQPVPQGSSLPAWPPATANNTLLMHLGDTIELRNSPMKPERIQLWEDIYERYYRHPGPPRSDANVISYTMVMYVVVTVSTLQNSFQ